MPLRRTLLLALAATLPLVASCRHAPDQRARFGIEKACRMLADRPRFLGAVGCEWDGGSESGLFWGGAQGCHVETGDDEWVRDPRTHFVLSSDSDGLIDVACGGLFELCGRHYACQCAQPRDGGQVGPREFVVADGGSKICLATHNDLRQRSLDSAAIPLDCPSAETDADGELVCHGEITGAVTEAITKCYVREGSDLRHGVAKIGAMLLLNDLGSIELQEPLDQVSPPPETLADVRITSATAKLTMKDARVFVLTKESPRRGYADLITTSVTDLHHGADYWEAHPHGCLSARLDQQLPDGGLGPATVYVRLSF